MDDELPGQSRVDELHGKTPGLAAGPCCNPVEKTVRDEAVAFRGKDNGKKFFLKTKGGDTEHDGHGDDFNNRRPQHVQVLPKAQAVRFVFLCHVTPLSCRYFRD